MGRGAGGGHGGGGHGHGAGGHGHGHAGGMGAGRAGASHAGAVHASHAASHSHATSGHAGGNTSALGSTLNRTPRASKSTESNPKTPRRGKSPGTGLQAHDRYVSKRSSSVTNLSSLNMSSLLMKSNLEETLHQDGASSPRSMENRKNLSNALLGEKKDTGRILEFRAKPAPAPEGFANPFSTLYTHSVGKPAQQKKLPRAIPTQPMRILDAPGLMNDFYLTRIDWGSNNLLAVALGNAVYLWNAETAAIEELFSTPDNGAEHYVSSVAWLPGSNFLAVGNDQNEVQIWDAAAKRRIRMMRGHTNRVACLDWNEFILASGSRSGNIHFHDVRVADPFFGAIQAHSQEVCGLKWSPDKKYLASGGNDNILNIWGKPSENVRNETPINSFTLHKAAIKALAWCPWQNSVIASGGGTADRTIKLWNVTVGTLITSKETDSQVSGIVWSEEYRELVTAHGYAKNELILWKYPSFERMSELIGHTERILDLCLSSDKSIVVSSSADQTISLWNLFPIDLEKKKKDEREKESQQRPFGNQCIR